jgi:hypothetical protein
VDLTGWTAVYGKDGAVLGYTAPGDVETPHERSLRMRLVRARAAPIDEAAALMMDEAFDLDETFTAAETAMPGPMVNSAGHIALTLEEVERWGLMGDD